VLPNHKKALVEVNRLYYERFMKRTNELNGHFGPQPGIVAIVYCVLAIAGLCPVLIFTDGSRLPGPWEPQQVIATYFQGHASALRLCAFFQFGSAIPLGIFTATVASRLRFLGVRAAGPIIALFGGVGASFAIIASALLLWVMTVPGIAQDEPVILSLYYLAFASGGVGFAALSGLLFAGVSVTSAFTGLLPRWLVIFGLFLAVAGELSTLTILLPQTVFLIPLTRFPGFAWLIATGFTLPKSRASSPSVTQAHA
jgi:hypothetical protein